MKIRLKSTSLMVTERCTLRCKLCLSYTPYYEKPEILKACDAERILQRYFSIVDYVDKFAITGGEPLTNPEIVNIMECIYSFQSQIGEIIFITNGTILWPQKLLEIMKKKEHQKNTKIIINNYLNLSKYAEENYKKLYDDKIFENEWKEKVILYGEDNRYGWIDCRTHELRHKTIEERNRQAAYCAFYGGGGSILLIEESYICVHEAFIEC